MADLTSWIGGTIGFVAAARDIDATATEYAATKASPGFDEAVNIKTIGALGDTSSAINVSLLAAGRAVMVNGELSAGEVPIAVAYDSDDTSYTGIRDLANTNDNVWFEVTDADGDLVYFQGVVANWQETERNNTTEKGATYVLRINTGFVYVPAP